MLSNLGGETYGRMETTTLLCLHFMNVVQRVHKTNIIIVINYA
jgi:hypothetical protein